MGLPILERNQARDPMVSGLLLWVSSFASTSKRKLWEGVEQTDRMIDARSRKSWWCGLILNLLVVS